MCELLPFTADEFTAIAKSLWWYLFCSTYGTYSKVLSDVSTAAVTRLAELQGVPEDRAFQSSYNFSKKHDSLKRHCNAIFQHQAFVGVHRVSPVSGVVLGLMLCCECMDYVYVYVAEAGLSGFSIDW